MAMNVPFRQQASKYDCVPTSLINGLCYLFDRKEVPPAVIHSIYKNSLDDWSLDQWACRGTSRRAITEICHILNGYQESGYKSFAVRSQFIDRNHVHLRPNSKIIECIQSKGAALLRVHLTEGYWHYILAFDTDDEWLYCYDPFPRPKQYLNNSDVIFVNSARDQEPNLIIKHKWLDKDVEVENVAESKASEHKYIFGPKCERECLLLIRPK